MKLRKYHGLGNDYLVLEESGGVELTPALVRAICHRNKGVGGDGILELRPSEVAEYGLRIHNPDGSIAEKSGNGLRIFARWLERERGAPSSFGVEVPAGVARCEVLSDELIRVQMGRATFEPSLIPVVGDGELVAEPHATLPLAFTAVGVGNPHCVVVVERPFDELPWREWGAALEVDPLFPNRVNVQFVRVVDRRAIELRIWERGAGETLASGSSASACVAACLKRELVDPGVVEARMEGGVLTIEIDDEYNIDLTGPVEEVCVATLEPPLPA